MKRILHNYWKKMLPLNRRGMAIIFAYGSVALLIVLVGSLALRAISELHMAERNLVQTRALYLAEGSIELVSYNLAYAVANHQSEPLASTPASIDSLTFAPSAGFMPTDFSVTYTCEAIDADHTKTDSNGVSTIVKNYKISATPTNVNFLIEHTPFSMPLNQIISRKKTYTFQHAVFYNDDLEMLPGPNMTLSGKVHCNSDIYLGSHNTLTVDSDYMYSAGDIYMHRKDNGSILGGDVKIKIKDESSYAYMFESGDTQPLDSDNPNWTDESQTRWKGTVKSSVHGVSELAVPEVGSIQPDGYYASQAGLKITDGVLVEDGFVLTQGIDVPAGTITTTTNSFYNNREGTYVEMVEVDMRKLAGYDEGDPDGIPSFPNHLPDNGLLYATISTPISGNEPGVRLKDGAEIDSSTGLTVVSDLPVYIEGDYNNINKVPAAVICDSVNFLSNSWDDGTGYASASNTYVNAAFIGGVDTTTSGHYNGGLENYPRMHENWHGKTLYIRGSFVELWNSQIAQGEWHYGAPYYKAPIRDWDYDSAFNDESNLPPFTPFAVEVERVAWWKD